jgi:hypothetical protein
MGRNKVDEMTCDSCGTSARTHGDDNDPRWHIDTAPLDFDPRVADMVKSQEPRTGNLHGYLNTTRPSDYDLEGRWFCTIGKSEYEWDAWDLVRYLQQNGDVWKPVKRRELATPGHRGHHNIGRLDCEVEMQEWWLERLQDTRRVR